MSLQTQFMTFFISPISESSASAELNNFLKSHHIINIEKRLIDGERGTGWVFLVEYSDIDGTKSGYTMSAKIDCVMYLIQVSLLFMIFCEKQEKKSVINQKFPFTES